MKKKLNFLLPVLLIAAGAFVSGYAFKWGFDILGIALMLGGAGLATRKTIKSFGLLLLYVLGRGLCF